MNIDNPMDSMSDEELRALGDALYEEGMREIATGTASQEMIRAVNTYRIKIKQEKPQ